MLGGRWREVILFNANVIVNEGVYEFISFYSPHVPTQSSDLHGLQVSHWPGPVPVCAVSSAGTRSNPCSQERERASDNTGAILSAGTEK